MRSIRNKQIHSWQIHNSTTPQLKREEEWEHPEKGMLIRQADWVNNCVLSPKFLLVQVSSVDYLSRKTLAILSPWINAGGRKEGFLFYNLSPSIYRWGKLRSREVKFPNIGYVLSTSQRHLLPPKLFTASHWGSMALAFEAELPALWWYNPTDHKRVHISVPRPLKATGKTPKSSWQEKRKVPISGEMPTSLDTEVTFYLLLLAVSCHLLDYNSTAMGLVHTHRQLQILRNLKRSFNLLDRWY